MEENNQETNPISNQETNTVKKNNGAALASFILSLIGLIVAGIPCGIAAVVSGITALSKFNSETQKNKWMAIFGIVLGIFDAVVVALLLPYILKANLF